MDVKKENRRIIRMSVRQENRMKECKIERFEEYIRK